MRVISQNGAIDVPYENFVFSITKDNCIVATRDSIGRPSEISSGIMAKYSIQEKAEKAMHILHEAYSDMSVIFQNIEISDEEIPKIESMLKNVICVKIPDEPSKVEYINNVIFRFPKEEDL